MMLKIGDFSRLSQVSVKALRYYDEIGLLKPAQIDRFTNYRYYAVDQLPRLNRILALKDLGLSLEEIALLLQEALSPDRMRDLLQRKQVELRQQLAEEHARLARVEARLHQIEHEGLVPEQEVVLKPVETQRVVAVRGVVLTYAQSSELYHELGTYLGEHGVDPLTLYPYMALYHDPEYRERDVDITVAAPLGRALPESERIKIEELPGATMVAVVHRGPYNAMGSAYTALMHWLGTNAYQIAGLSRHLYLHGPGQSADPATFITEIQFPVVPV